MSIAIKAFSSDDEEDMIFDENRVCIEMVAPAIIIILE